MWDNELIFSNKQLLADADSENLIDTGGPEAGLGGTVQLQVSLSSGCTGELAISLDSSNSPVMANAVRVVQYIVDEPRVAKGGVVLAAPLPTGCKRFVRLKYAGASGGYVTAGLTMNAQTAGIL